MNEQVTPVIEPIKKKGINISKETMYIAIIVAVLVMGVGYIAFYMFTPKVRFVTALTSSYDKVFETLKIDENRILQLSNDKKALVTTNATIKTTGLSDLFGMTDLNLGIDAVVTNDPDKESLQYDYTLLSENKSIIGVNGILTKDKIYMTIKDIMTNYYYTGGKYSNFLSTNDYSNYIYLLDMLKDSVSTSLKSDDFKQSKGEITQGVDKGTYTKLSLEMNEKMINDIAITMLNKIIKDEKAQNIILDLNITGTYSSKKELIKELNDQIKEIEKEKPSTKTELTYNVYIKGYNTVVRHEIVMDKDNSIAYDIYTKGDQNYKAFTVIGDSKKQVEIAFREISKGVYEVNGLFGKDVKITGTLKNTETLFSFDIKVEAEGEEIEIAFSTEQKEISAEKEYDIATSFKIAYQGVSLEMKSTNKYEFGKEQTKLDLSKAKSMEEMKEEEITEISEKILEIPIIKEYFGITSTINDSYDPYDTYNDIETEVY